MNENLSLQMLQRFMGQPVTVDTSVGSVVGILRKADSSQHRGVGNLLLEGPGGWLLIKEGVSVKRR